MLRVYLTDVDASSSLLMTHYQLCLAASAIMVAVVAGECGEAVSNMTTAMRTSTATNQTIIKAIMAPDFAAPVALLKHDDAGTRVAAVNKSMLACTESGDLWAFMQMLENKEIIQRVWPAVESLGKESGKGHNEVLITSKQANDKQSPKADWKISVIQEGYLLLFHLRDDPNSMKVFGSDAHAVNDSLIL